MEQRLLEMLRRHGRNPVSFQILKPGLETWWRADGSATVAYADTGRYWIAAGIPRGPVEDLVDVVLEFSEAARASGRKAAFFGPLEEAVARLREGPRELDVVRIGVQAVWDPRNWSTVSAPPSEVARQVRRAARKGVTVAEARAAELSPGTPLRLQAEELIETWLTGRSMAQMRFLVDLDVFAHSQERRYFVARRGDELVGFLACVPIYARRGWFMENLIVERRAPNGTSESLVDLAMRTFEVEGAEYATLGLVPLASTEGAVDHPVLAWLFRFSYNNLNWLYGFRGLLAFKAKFRPERWEPVYLVAPRRITLGTLHAVLSAFAGGYLPEFAGRTARKLVAHYAAGVPASTWAGFSAFLAAALIPWIAILLSLDSNRWFGSAWLSAAWASFDVAVAAAFALLARLLANRRPGYRPLARTLLGVVLADMWLTVAQALLYNLRNIVYWWDWILVAGAVSAPPLAAAYLGLLLLARPVTVEPADRT